MPAAMHDEAVWQGGAGKGVVLPLTRSSRGLIGAGPTVASEPAARAGGGALPGCRRRISGWRR